LTRPLNRKMTLIEVMVASGLFTGLLLLAGLSLQISTETLQLTSSMTMSTLEADRVLRVLRTELRSASSATLTVTPAPVLPLGPAGANITSVTYETFDPTVPLLDTANPFNTPATTQRLIRFEADGTEILGNGLDDDGDFLIDEGRVALYNAPGLPADLIAVVGTNILGLQVARTNAAGGGLAKVQIWLRVQRVILGATDNPAVDLANGAGPRATHVVNAHFSLLN
jgi:type II secretory pathway pseudopilin PulG